MWVWLYSFGASAFEMKVNPHRGGGCPSRGSLSQRHDIRASESHLVWPCRYRGRSESITKPAQFKALRIHELAPGEGRAGATGRHIASHGKMSM